jgi:hypothetical protein
MNHVVWYVAEALMADLWTRHHHLRAASEGEVERKVRRRYPGGGGYLGAPGRVVAAGIFSPGTHTVKRPPPLRGARAELPRKPLL